MTKTIIAALSVALGLGLSMSAGAAETTLAAKHGPMFPKETAWAVKDQCLKCHQSYEVLGQRTANLVPNPHINHIGAVNCTECHKADKPSRQPELMCNECHNFKIVKKAAK